MQGIKSALLILVVVGACVAFPSDCDCDIETISPKKPFRFAQQIYWDNRTNSVFFADTDALAGNPSLYRFDWKSKKLYSASLKNAKDPAPVSFLIPAESSSQTLIAGQTNSVLKLEWDGLSKTAKILDTIATRDESAHFIDRGATSPDGTLYMSLMPEKYCKENRLEKYSAAAIVYLSSTSHSFEDALLPGTYSNGLSFDPKTKKCYIGDDCSASIIETDWNGDSLTIKREVFRFPRETAKTNYPVGLEVDQCSNFYVGDHNSGWVGYIDPKTGKVLKEYKVPGTHVTSLGICGPKLDHLCVVTGTEYNDSDGGSVSSSKNPGDGKLYVVPVSPSCSGFDCKGYNGTPVGGV